ncbi:DUF742 domain-containing protein [Streptomyces sp. NPDC058256]|uniref:DUF742 domain-containing protein n=1 Tax=Streptomyces sp. NPDC058256 TaxID=3346408 RepID=UPI0036DFB1D3
MTASRRDRGPGLVGLYVMTGGRSAPSRNHFDLITRVLIANSGLERAGLTPEQCAVLDLCLPGALSVAEIGARLSLPLSVLRILLADLMETGHVTTSGTILATPRSDQKLLEDVLAGLRKL